MPSSIMPSFFYISLDILRTYEEYYAFLIPILCNHILRVPDEEIAMNKRTWINKNLCKPFCW